MLENVNNLLENETERLLSWRGEGRELVCQSLPRGYAEKCFDFDSIKVDQLILISRGTQRRFPPNCISKLCLGYAECFYIPRNVLKVALKNLYLFAHPTAT